MTEYNRAKHPRIYYDAEFTGLHRTSTLISIGMVTSKGNTFYAEFTDYDQSQLNPWLRENVIDNLLYNDKTEFRDVEPFDPADYDGACNLTMKGDSTRIRHHLHRWLLGENDSNPDQIPLQIFTDCYAYDMMLLVDLLTKGGTAFGMPTYIHYIPIDLSTALHEAGIDPDISREEFANVSAHPELRKVQKHNALYDAQVIKACFNRLALVREQQ